MTATQLRNSILQEAFAGKLVPQNLSDGNANEFLSAIHKEKLRFAKEGMIKKKELVDIPIGEHEIPYEIPSNWMWVRLRSVVYNHGQKTPTNKFSYIDIGSIDNKHQRLNLNENIIDAKNAPSRARKIVTAGDIIYSTVRPYLHNMAIVDREFTEEPIASTGFAVFTCHQGLFNKFLFYYLLSPAFDSYANDGDNAKGVAYPAINDDKLYKAIIPLPPLAEQQRIVAKLEELLPIVEQYGKAQTELDELNSALPVRIRQSILQEAISGRLVPQIGGESAEKLFENLLNLAKVAANKKKWISSPISDDEIAYYIPDSWRWIRLGDIVYTQTGLSYSKGDLEKKVEEPIRVLRGGNIQNGSWTIKPDDVMIAPEYVKKDISLKKNTFITPAVTSLEHLGKTALIREDHSDIVAGGFVLYLIPYDTSNDVLMEYLSYFFQSSFYNKFCKSITNKSGQAFWNISREKLLQLPIPLPPKEEQKRIVAKIEETFSALNF